MIFLKNISKKFEDKAIFNNFNLEIEEGKVLAILGESGVGKTTLLSIISNNVSFSGEVSGNITPISYVFQEDRLIPNLTVKENLNLVCKNIDVNLELKKVGLENVKDYLPKMLSGGMKRRVALLRAFCFEHKTLLMDEPFNSLDISKKYDLINLTKKLHNEKQNTIIFVTHDILEAVNLADRIVIIEGGKIVKDIKKITNNTAQEIEKYFLGEQKLFNI